MIGEGERDTGAGVTTAVDPGHRLDASQIREVTDAEVQRFWDNGWTFLPGLVDANVAGELLARAKRLMGDGGDQNELRSGFDYETAPSSQPFRRPGDSDQFYRSFVRSPMLGRNAALLLGRDSATRFFDDCLLVKLPVQQRPDRGQALQWHQDSNPTDRTWLLFWIALDDISVDQGVVRYLEGSQKLGALWRGGSCIPLDHAYEIAPRLRSCPLSQPLAFRAGDAIAHGSGVVHSTDANLGNDPRWVYRLAYFPADAVYMGGPSDLIRSKGIETFDMLDHEDFPVVYAPEAGGGAPTGSRRLDVRRYHEGS